MPELPSDEAKLGELTLRETLAKHREHKSCAGCHERFDSFGLVFEGYGPIGERREQDLGGRPVETRADVSRRQRRRRARTACAATCASTARTIFSTTSAASCYPMRLGRSLLPSDDSADRARCGRSWPPTTIASAAWSKRSSPARSF